MVEAVADSLLTTSTPALVLDRGKLRANADRLTARLKCFDVDFRPHMKTAKSIDVARIITRGWSGAVTVSTLKEAAYFADAGFDDILYAVGFVPGKMAQALSIARKISRLTVILDSQAVARDLARLIAPAGPSVGVLLELDTDGHRGGLRPDAPELLDLAAAVAEARHLTLEGVMTHAGESYTGRSAADFCRWADVERSGAVEAAERLRRAGFPCRVVSVGSTPTALFAENLDGVTEVRAGVYAFGDLYQAGIGAVAYEDLALSVLATVVGHRRDLGRILIDAGFLALSRDRSTAALPTDMGYGLLCDVEGRPLDSLTVSGANQEHGIVSAPPWAFERLPIGARVRILPNHACATAAAYARYEVVEGSVEIQARWDRINGW